MADIMNGRKKYRERVSEVVVGDEGETKLECERVRLVPFKRVFNQSHVLECSSTLGVTPGIGAQRCSLGTRMNANGFEKRTKGVRQIRRSARINRTRNEREAYTGHMRACISGVEVGMCAG